MNRDIILDFSDFGVVTEKDPRLYDCLVDFARYLKSVYGDKYFRKGIEVDPNVFTVSSKYGKGFNMGNACKYISRYLSEGYEKSSDVEDLMKAIHYLFLEYARVAFPGEESGWWVGALELSELFGEIKEVGK
jgi:hypothetical protein